MPATFSQTTRALDSDRPRRGLAALGTAFVLLAIWGYWFVSAEVTEWEVSETAHVQIERAAHPVDAPIAGRVVASRLQLGSEVHAGEVVIELESESERRRLAQERAKLAGMDPQIDALRKALVAFEAVLTTERGVTVTAVKEGQARQREAEATARLAAEEAKRAGTLFDGGAIAELELLRAKAENERRKGATEALGFGVQRYKGELRTAESRDLATIEQLRKDIVELEGQRAVTAAVIDVLTFEIERRAIVASTDGRVADAQPLKIGAWVREGDHLGAIVPLGKPTLVATFAPRSAMGRVRAGQVARARVESFPWIEFGTVPASVAAVGSEPRDGHVSVELAVDPAGNPRIPLEHGLVCSIEVAVGKASPATLLLRSIGAALGPTTAPSAVPSGSARP